GTVSRMRATSQAKVEAGREELPIHFQVRSFLLWLHKEADAYQVALEQVMISANERVERNSERMATGT
ncbi:MAG: hypothetical protein WAV38_16580, partial [Xanthobacteraceae bacterium]